MFFWNIQFAVLFQEIVFSFRMRDKVQEGEDILQDRMEGCFRKDTGVGDVLSPEMEAPRQCGQVIALENRRVHSFLLEKATDFL